jgi:hypothetical protein
MNRWIVILLLLLLFKCSRRIAAEKYTANIMDYINMVSYFFVPTALATIASHIAYHTAYHIISYHTHHIHHTELIARDEWWIGSTEWSISRQWAIYTCILWSQTDGHVMDGWWHVPPFALKSQWYIYMVHIHIQTQATTGRRNGLLYSYLGCHLVFRWLFFQTGHFIYIYINEWS